MAIFKVQKRTEGLNDRWYDEGEPCLVKAPDEFDVYRCLPMLGPEQTWNVDEMGKILSLEELEKKERGYE